MKREEFTALPASVALGLLWDAMHKAGDAAGHLLEGTDPPRPLLPPKFDTALYGRDGMSFASECDLKELRYHHKRAAESASGGGQYADKDAKKASALERWINWREQVPERRLPSRPGAGCERRGRRGIRRRGWLRRSGQRRSSVCRQHLQRRTRREVVAEMSTSTDAILLYGIPLEDESIDEYDESDENAPETGPSWMAFMGKSEAGVTLVRHCSDSCPMYFLAIPTSETRAWRGHPRPVVPDSLTVGANWNALLRAYAKKHKLKTTGDAGWWLASDWG